MTLAEIQTLVNFILTELRNGISLEKLYHMSSKQWGRDKAQTVWWYWRCQYDHFDNHSLDFLLK